MTSELRWRIMTLQAVLVLILAVGAGFLFWALNYTHSSVRTQLVAQSITFPAKGDPSISAAALTPCASLAKNATCPIATGASVGRANAAAMAKYAGQVMTTGEQAQTYANNFMQVHLADMGYTYSGISALALKNPGNASYQNLANTIFKGTTLRGMLLNAYGWWSMGTYAGDAAIGVLLAAFAVFGAFLFELLAATRKVAFPVRRVASKKSQVATA
jgi:hypothetical protein